jgi:hypothetical protein
MKTVNRQHEAMLGMSECSVIFQKVVLYEEAGRILGLLLFGNNGKHLRE